MLRIEDHLHVDWVHTDLKSADKPGVLRELAEHIGQLGLVADDQLLYHALLAREQLVTTAIGQSIAIPHTQSLKIERTLLIPALHPAGVDFDAPDDLPVHLLLLIIGNSREVSGHLQLLCHVSRVVRHGDCLARLRQATTAQQVFDCLVETEQQMLQMECLSRKTHLLHTDSCVEALS